MAEFATALCVRRINTNVAFRQPVNPYKCITKEYMLATLLGAKNRMQGFCTARFCPLNKPSCFLKWKFLHYRPIQTSIEILLFNSISLLDTYTHVAQNARLGQYFKLRGICFCICDTLDISIWFSQNFEKEYLEKDFEHFLNSRKTFYLTSNFSRIILWIPTKRKGTRNVQRKAETSFLKCFLPTRKISAKKVKHDEPKTFTV